jgi:hypothetical protein
MWYQANILTSTLLRQTDGNMTKMPVGDSMKILLVDGKPNAGLATRY